VFQEETQVNVQVIVI